MNAAPTTRRDQEISGPPFLYDPISWLARRVFRRTLLEGGGGALPMARLCTSEHVRDLRYIATFLFCAAVVAAVTLLVYGAELVNLLATPTPWLLAFAGTLGAACFGGVNWAYQAGNRRLGAVDLFACEISVICRVCLVVGFAESSVRTARSGEFSSRRFTSEEHYTPVYDSQISEIEPLDVDVVTSVTEFYTYRKTMIDYLRAYSVSTDTNERSALYDLMIYMQFLMYESGRHAIGKLIEFEPNRAESLVNVLCSELVVYGHLYEKYQGDFRGDRLRIRHGGYVKTVEELDKRIRERADLSSWQRAYTTTPAMMERYRAMLRVVEAARQAVAERPALPLAGD